MMVGITDFDNCPDCLGTGLIPGTRNGQSERCWTCEGTGVVPSDYTVVEPIYRYEEHAT